MTDLGPAPPAAAATPSGRFAALLLGVAVALGACQPSATTRPGTTAPTSVPSAVSTPPTASRPLAEVLRDGISVDRILTNLQRLQDEASRLGGARSAGSEAEAAAIDAVASELRSLGYAVELQPVSVTWFHEDAPSVLEIDGIATTLENVRDFKAMLLSASGDVRGPLYALGFDAAAAPGARDGTGCAAADWDGVPSGVVVLVQPGRCFRRDVVVNAQRAGAVAILTAYPEWHRDAVLRPTLINAADIKIPALSLSREAGLAVAAAASAGRQAHVEVHASVEARTSRNVIADSPTGDPAHIVMVGGHIDTSIDGPGINDDGSGTMTVLELARALASAGAAEGLAEPPAWRVRFAFWTGEEIGLIGSGAYARSLDVDGLDAIEAYLNLDMLGSRNGVREVYAGDVTTRPAESTTITTLFGDAFTAAGLPFDTVALGGVGDHASFDDGGVPTGGIFSGANELKTDEGAARFGGTAGEPNDRCYHLACDTVDGIDRTLLEQMARAAAWVLGRLASGEVVLGG